MRLIDADELLAQMIGMNDGWFDPRPAYDHESLIKIQPTVGAVPLDKLCLLLHDIAGCPCYTQPGEDMCNQLIGDQCNTEWDDVECWKQFLTKWMEAQDAAD